VEAHYDSFEPDVRWLKGHWCREGRQKCSFCSAVATPAAEQTGAMKLEIKCEALQVEAAGKLASTRPSDDKTNVQNVVGEHTILMQAWT
jgi:hypothetical protein